MIKSLVAEIKQIADRLVEINESASLSHIEDQIMLEAVIALYEITELKENNE